MHRTLEAFYRERVGTADHLFGCYNEQWVNEGFDSPQQAQEFFEKGEKMLSEYWTANKDSSSEVLQLEKEFIIELGSHRLRGTIDRIDRLSDGGYEVIDYKTHAELWDEQRASGDLQLSLYAIACTKSFGVPPARLSYYFLAHNRKISTTRTAQQLQEAIGIVQETAAKIMRREYGTNTAHCSRCDFKKKCPQSVCK
jgi:RecB family exonuclease